MGANITINLTCDVCKDTKTTANRQLHTDMLHMIDVLPVGWNRATIDGKIYYTCGSECWVKVGTMRHKQREVNNGQS
jgi:hypothetical protein